MTKTNFAVCTLAIAALIGGNHANAQQNQVGASPLPSESQSGTAGTQSDQGDRYEARRISTDANQQGPTVKEALVQKLQKSNEAEIELAELAMNRTDNEDVKNLAQMLVQDHRQLNETLRRHVGQSHDRQTNSLGNSHHQSNSANETRSGYTDTRRTNAQDSGASYTHTSRETVPRQLCQISEQACDNASKMTKDMLSKYDGQNFNMAFLGQQCVAHTMMIAELKAIESNGPEELQSFAQQAIEKVQQHLDKAKQLAKQLEDNEPSNS
tara:strand:+ start:186265 stop:187068 length:804 start_codon:yes stop_codon:yes gene_type:complete